MGIAPMSKIDNPKSSTSLVCFSLDESRYESLEWEANKTSKFRFQIYFAISVQKTTESYSHV